MLESGRENGRTAHSQRKRDNMDTRRLGYFVAIVDYGSLTRAAERVHIAQPALSQHLTALEQAFGQPLLRRGRQGVSTTPAGRVLYRHAQTILRQMKQLEADVGSASSVLSGHVSVGLPVSCAAILSMPLLKAVRERHPQLLLQISENLSGLLGELVLNSRLDMALLYGAHGSQGLGRRPLLVERLSLVCPQSLAPPGDPTAAVEVASLAQTPLVLPSHSNGLRALVDAAFSRRGLKPRIIAEIDSLPSLRAAVEHGVAATVLPRSATGASRRDLQVRDIIEPTIERTLVLCRPSAMAASEPAAAIEALLVEIIEDLVGSGHWQGVSPVGAAAQA
jgi:LysR family transcriptional regulator, nitrogen assimilation regulatory protein